MSVSTIELAKARDTANAILEALQLDAYIFELEPQDETWELTIECACEIDGSWKTIKLQVPRQLLLGSFADDEARAQLVDYWKKQLADCKLLQT